MVICGLQFMQSVPLTIRETAMVWVKMPRAFHRAVHL